MTEVSPKHPQRDPLRLNRDTILLNSVVKVTQGHNVLFSLESSSEMAVSLLPMEECYIPAPPVFDYSIAVPVTLAPQDEHVSDLL